MADTIERGEQWIAGLTGGDAKAKLIRLLPLLAGEDGKKLMGMLYLTGSDPQKMRAALEKAMAGDAEPLRAIMARLLAEPEGAEVLGRILQAMQA